MDWTEKYRPKSLSSVVGNPKAVADLTIWAKQWNNGTPKQRAVVLIGSPGVGKTTCAEALALEMGWDIVEMNSSDQRTGDAIRENALRGSSSNTFSENGEFLSVKEGKRKLIVLDEADSFFGNADRGAMPVIAELIRTTKQPVMLIVNDFYELSRKSSVVKNETLQIKFQKPTTVAVVKALKNICKNEGIDTDDAVLKRIAENSNGDVRAAVRDLESVAAGRGVVEMEHTDELSNRIVKKDMYDLMYATFRKSDPMGARRIMMDVDEEPRTVMMWVDENLPYEYRDPGDLVRGYEKLSRADIFLGRVHRRQYYGFWSYAGDLMIGGVATARRSRSVSSERIKFPSYLSKLSRSKSVRTTKAALCQKLADYTHNSTKRVAQDILDPIKTLFNSDFEFRVSLTYNAKLDEDDVGFLMGAKSDSKTVKKVLTDAIEYGQANMIKTAETEEPVHPPVVAKKPEPKPAVVEKPVEEVKNEIPADKENVAKEKPGGQRSLFDF